MSARCIVLIVCVVVSIANSTVLGLEHCGMNNYRQSLNSSHMQYTREPVNREYAVLNQFKSLHCCAKGYRSIEWFKDGKPYPFPGLILYPEEANQTIYTRDATMAVAGNYTCLLRNDTHKMEHHVELIVKNSPPETPLATFEPQSLLELQEGDVARFYCEAFVGNLGLPDEKSEISWHRVHRNGQLEKLHSVEIVKRENEQVLGAILSLNDVREEDYGDYLCRIEMANPAHRLEMKSSLHISPTVAKTENQTESLAIVAGVLFALLIFLILVGFWRRHRVWKHKLNSLPHRDQMYDSATIEMSLRHPSSSRTHGHCRA